MKNVLHVLSQRPLLTGSGITLNALVRLAGEAGWDQRVVVGTPVEDPNPAVDGLAPERVHPLLFGTEALPFPVPGMSDVMPYSSSRFSLLTPAQLKTYRDAWREHLRAVVAEERLGLIHVHHAWIVASLLKDLFPETPVVAHCHATGLRQLELCPHLADEIRDGLGRNELFLVLHAGDARRLSTALDVPMSRVRIVGAGYREELFYRTGRPENTAGELLYVGKYSSAKGLPWLLDAVQELGERRAVRLHVAGGGAGWEARELEERMRAMGDLVVLHGSLAQEELAALMRRCVVCVLPSFYEGLPLVLVEAAACGCRLVATELEGIRDELALPLAGVLEMVPPPRLFGVDSPVEADLPGFVEGLIGAIERSLEAGVGAAAERAPEETLHPFTWTSTFERVEAAWLELLGAS
ncbi:MAG: glycosyltransferase family 4 protein [bacterium]|nr:glycosyltransferase family 4 protein [bacterium]